MESTALHTSPARQEACDICHRPILNGEKIHDDGDEIAHATCIRAWFRGNFGREALR